MISDCSSNYWISIHAPTRGATLFFPKVFRINYFNPRSHERSDKIHDLARSETWISIHAPTRGATSHSMDLRCLIVFQSTLPREERPARHEALQNALLFQSTLPREERLAPVEDGHSVKNISIHAPTRGATMKTVLSGQNEVISIHAPTRGATMIYYFI